MNLQEVGGLSARVQQLLAGPERYEVEFKESLSGFDSADLVAFANSATGGALLIGVRESSLADGRQRGEVVGCDVSDKARMQILNRAASCIPPIEIEVVVENADQLPFLRIEVPSGRDKPYCTGGGRYKIRGNARTNTLTPRQLLNIFMESESRRFVKRFGRATRELEQQLDETRSNIIADTEAIARKLAQLEEKLDGLLQSAGEVEQRQAEQQHLYERISQIETLLRTLVNGDTSVD